MTGYVVVRVGARRLAVPMDAVVEVFRMVAMAAQLPRAPRHCLGVVDCRGRLVPVFDLGARLGITKAREPVALVDAHVLLVRDPVGEVGYAVDEVVELVEQAAEPVPGSGTAATGAITLGAVRGAGGELAPAVSPAALLTVLARHQLRAALEALEKQGREAST
jgi:purine-binding chemotaxis protein CheW